MWPRRRPVSQVRFERYPWISETVFHICKGYKLIDACALAVKHPYEAGEKVDEQITTTIFYIWVHYDRY
jgi:hypothetical protein